MQCDASNGRIANWHHQTVGQWAFPPERRRRHAHPYASKNPFMSAWLSAANRGHGLGSWPSHGSNEASGRGGSGGNDKADSGFLERQNVREPCRAGRKGLVEYIRRYIDHTARSVCERAEEVRRLPSCER